MTTKTTKQTTKTASTEQEIHRQRVRSKHEIHLYDLNNTANKC